MAQVVEPGTVPSSPVGDPTAPEELAEGVVDRLTEVRSTLRGGEEGDIRGADAQGVRIAPEVLAERRRHGDEAILSVLPLANDQDPRDQVDFTDA